MKRDMAHIVTEINVSAFRFYVNDKFSGTGAEDKVLD